MKCTVLQIQSAPIDREYSCTPPFLRFDYGQTQSPVKELVQSVFSFVWQTFKCE